MKEKKTEVITFRTTERVKEKLGIEAEKRGWSISQLVERIIAEYTVKENSQINFIGNEINEINFN